MTSASDANGSTPSSAASQNAPYPPSMISSPCATMARRSSPSQRIAPAHGRTRPATQLRSVLLPAPFGPSSATISPGAIDSVTPESTRTSPYPASSPAISSTRVTPHVAAEVDVDDVGIRRHLRRRPVGDLLAGAQHDDAPGE